MENQTTLASSQLTTEQSEKFVKALKDLAEICHTGHQGYTTAAENVKNSEYAALFNSLSSQRHSFENELKQHILRLGGDLETSNAVQVVADAAGALHRGWINLKAAVTGGGVEAILDECQRGDEAAVKAYQEVMAMQLPGEIAQVVRQQFQSIQEAYTRVKGLARVEA